jgi:hypothetical protein
MITALFQNLGLNIAQTYLETHVCLLTTCNILAWAWNNDNWNVIIVSSQEALCAGHNVADNDGCA